MSPSVTTAVNIYIYILNILVFKFWFLNLIISEINVLYVPVHATAAQWPVLNSWCFIWSLQIELKANKNNIRRAAGPGRLCWWVKTWSRMSFTLPLLKVKTKPTSVWMCRDAVVVAGVGAALHLAAGGRFQPHVFGAHPFQQCHRRPQAQRLCSHLHCALRYKVRIKMHALTSTVSSKVIQVSCLW